MINHIYEALLYYDYIQRDDLIGKFYKCIFNESAKKYDGKIHYHLIIGAWEIKAPDNIIDGLALELDCGEKFGCSGKNIVKNPQEESDE